MFVSLRRAQTWHLHTKLFKFWWHTSANNSRMKNSRDLILGEVVYISTTYRIQDSWDYWLNGYDFLVLIAWLVKTENSLPLKKRSSFGWSSKQEYTRHGTMQQNSCDALPNTLKERNAKFNLAPRVGREEERPWERSWRRIKQRKGPKAINNWKPLISLSN